MKRIAWLLVAAVMALAVTAAQGGHEFPVYPSYYPHEIQIETLAPERAAELLLAGKLHAYVGREPRFDRPIPESITTVTSLGALVVVRVNPQSKRIKDQASACNVANAAVRELAIRRKDLELHPYPITPFDGDYLYHADRAATAKARVLSENAGAAARALRGLKFREFDASGAKPDAAADWDVAVSDVDVKTLVAQSTFATNGWIAPPWAREGWFVASLILGPAIEASDLRGRVQDELARLRAGTYANTTERINLERELVAELTRPCHTTIAGYTLRRETLNTEYSTGVENIAFDALAGLDTPVFIRTAKLKDFPWNGWLLLGIDTPPTAAWNPIAGFTDPFGRLMWNAIGDPAVIPAPNDVGWILNRISDVQASPKP